MPVAPTNILASPDKDVAEVPFVAIATAGNSLTTEVAVAQRTGYVTKATLIPVGAATADPTNKRTWTVVDASTRAPVDGNIVAATAGKGLWNVATVYAAGDWVVLNNLPYVCISAVTGGTGPGLDTTKWSQVAQVGLAWVNSLTAVFTKDDIGKAWSDAGNTNIPASSFIGAVVEAGSPGIAAGVSAACIVSVQPPGGQPNQVDGVPTVQAANAGRVQNQVNGVAVIGRTVTIGASRTLASFTCTTVSLVAGTPIPLVLGTDTQVYLGDVLKLVSTAVGTGVADPGGTVQVEVTNLGDGSD